MSEGEVKKARLDVEKSTADFEHALDRLLNQIEASADRLNQITDRTKDVASKMKEFVDVDSAVKHLETGFDELVNSSVTKAKESATRLISEMRVNAEEEFERMDKRPLVSWGAVLVSGFTLGYYLAKKTREVSESRGATAAER